MSKLGPLAVTFICLQAILPSVGAEAETRVPPTALSEEQKDDLIAMNLLATNPDSAKRVAAIGAAVHYTNTRYSGTRDLGELQIAEGLMLGNPFSEAAYRSIFSLPKLDAASREDSLKKIVDDVIANTEPQKLRATLTARNADAAPRITSIAASIMSSNAALLVDLSVNYLNKQGDIAKPYLPSREGQTIATLSRLQREIRLRSAEGKAIAEIYAKLLHDDPTQPSESKAPIQAALLELARLENARSDAKPSDGRFEIAFQKISDGIGSLRAQLGEQDKRSKERGVADAEVQKQKKLELEKQEQRNSEYYRDMNDLRAGLLVQGYILQIMGDREAARTVFAAADIANKVSTLVSQASTMAPLMLATGYVGVAIAVYTLLQSSNQPTSPFPEVFDMLQKLSKQINDLRLDMLNSIGQMDNHIGNLLLANIELTEATKRNTDAMRMQLNDIQTQLQNAQNALGSRIASIEDLFLSAEDRACIRIQNRQLLEPQPDFLRCQDTYLQRATTVAVDAVQNDQISEKADLAKGKGPFSFASRYQILQQDLKMPGQPVANPDVWFGAVSRYLLLLQHFPNYIGQIDLVSGPEETVSLTLDPMIQIGENIRTFLYSSTFSPVYWNSDQITGHHLKQDRFDNLLKELFQNYEIVLSELSKELSHTGVHADVTRTSQKQLADANYPHSFLSGSSVPFCTYKDAGLHVLSAKSLSLANEGGSKGIDELWSSPPLDEKFLGAQVDYAMRNHPATEFQPDGSIVSAISGPIRLWEMLQPGNAIQVCLQFLNVSNLDFSRPIRADISERYYVSVNIDGIKTVVEQLDGTRQITTPFFNYVDMVGHKHHDAVLSQRIAAELRGHYGEFLKSTPHAGMTKATERVDLILSRHRNNLRNRLAYKTQSDRIERLRTDLTMLASIGLNTQHVKVDEFLRSINDVNSLPTVSMLIDRAVLEGTSVADLSTVISRGFGSIRRNVWELAHLSPKDIVAHTDLLDLRINQLKILKELRSRQN